MTKNNALASSYSAPSPARLVAPPGLKGLVVTDTRIGAVRGGEGFYHYREHDAVDLARDTSFAQVAAVLLDDARVAPASAAEMRQALGAARKRVAPHGAIIAAHVAAGASPYAVLCAVLPLIVDDRAMTDLSPLVRRDAALCAIGAAPAILAAAWRTVNGDTQWDADGAMEPAADYLRLLTGRAPAPDAVRALGTYWSLTADHGLNASTFTARVVASTGAGMASSLTSALAALSGPLHGGAPSRVLAMLQALGDASQVAQYVDETFAAGGKVMGFGHAVYRTGDPRSALLREVALAMNAPWAARAVEIEAAMLEVLRAKKPHATLVTSVEFYAAVVLDAVGLPPEMFTATFAASRLVGWSAHILEQAASNKIMRPSARYTGTPPSVSARE